MCRQRTFVLLWGRYNRSWLVEPPDLRSSSWYQHAFAATPHPILSQSPGPGRSLKTKSVLENLWLMTLLSTLWRSCLRRAHCSKGCLVDICIIYIYTYIYIYIYLGFSLRLDYVIVSKPFRTSWGRQSITDGFWSYLHASSNWRLYACYFVFV